MWLAIGEFSTVFARRAESNQLAQIEEVVDYDWMLDLLAWAQ